MPPSVDPYFLPLNTSVFTVERARLQTMKIFTQVQQSQMDDKKNTEQAAAGKANQQRARAAIEKLQSCSQARMIGGS